MNRLLLAALGLALLASCTNEVAGLTCKSNDDCKNAWCDDGVCVACEPLGVPCTGPADAAAPGRDAAEPGLDARVMVHGDAGWGSDAEIGVAEDAALEPPDAGGLEDAGRPDAAEPGLDAQSPGQDVIVVVPVDAGGEPDAAVVPADAGTYDGGLSRPDAGLDGGSSRPDSGQPGTDAGAPGSDASAPSPDASAPGWDAAAPAADAAAPGADAGPTSLACHAPTNPLKGRCREGTSYLIDGSWGPCIGEVLPQAETCNGLDDDCDGQLDEGLVMRCGLGVCEKELPACVGGVVQFCAVSPVAGTPESCDGVDNDCDGFIDEEGCACVYVDGAGAGDDTYSGLTPKDPVATIKKGLEVASSHQLKRVCVSAGTCAQGAVVTYPEAVSMLNGVHLAGGYLRGDFEWKQLATCLTQIQASAPNLASVTFSSAVAVPTQLTGFILRANDADLARAVEVNGSAGAVITDNTIVGGKGANSRAVLVTAGARPRIEHNAIEGGLGTTSSVGIVVNGSTPIIRNHCGVDANAVTGACTLPAEDATARYYIRGRSASAYGGSPGTGSVGIDLENSAGAVVSQNAIGAGGATIHAVGVRIAGKVDGILLGQNTVRAVGEGASQGNPGGYAGVVVRDCIASGQTSPWIVGNSIANSSTAVSSAVGVQSVGACSPRIEANEIVGNQVTASGSSSYGIRCESDVATDQPSLCVVAANLLVAGNLTNSSSTGGAVGPLASGISCLGGSCQTIERNQKVTPGGANVTIGIDLQRGKAVVERNFVDAGCPAGTLSGVATGLRALDASARVVNNVIRGALETCTNRSFISTAAVTVESSPEASELTADELDLHSNDLVGGPHTIGTCIGSGLHFANGAPGTRKGLIRNNIIQAGGCTTSYAVREVGYAQPRVFTNNDLFGGLLYHRSGVLTLAEVNVKVGTANVSDDPGWDPDFHLAAGRQCIGSGTADQAPDHDLYGAKRVAPFDMGAVKYGP